MEGKADEMDKKLLAELAELKALLAGRGKSWSWSRSHRRSRSRSRSQKPNLNQAGPNANGMDLVVSKPPALCPLREYERCSARSS